MNPSFRRRPQHFRLLLYVLAMADNKRAQLQLDGLSGSLKLVPHTIIYPRAVIPNPRLHLLIQRAYTNEILLT